jgi:hypothetical protein
LQVSWILEALVDECVLATPRVTIYKNHEPLSSVHVCPNPLDGVKHTLLPAKKVPLKVMRLGVHCVLLVVHRIPSLRQKLRQVAAVSGVVEPYPLVLPHVTQGLSNPLGSILGSQARHSISRL